MSNQVYSSKSLLNAIGSETKKSLDESAKEPATNAETPGGSFLLASTVASVPKPEQPEKDATKSEESRNKGDGPNKEGENKDENRQTLKDAGKDGQTDSDAESVSSAIIMKTTDEKDNTLKSKTLQLLSLLNPSNLLSSHDLLLGAFYEEHRYELIEQKKVTMRVITWNLNQMKPPSLSTLAGKSGREWAAFFYAGDETVNDHNKEGLADIYAINFQETISLKSFTKSNVVIDEWVNFLLAVLNAISSDSYSLVHKTGLLGLTSILIAKSKFTSDSSEDADGQIHDVRENTLGLGYLRWANKGCISLRFRVGGVSLKLGDYKSRSLSKENTTYSYNFNELDETAGKIPGLEIQILNVHLVHGEDDSQIQQRWDSWAKIESKIGLDDRTVKLALDSSKMELKDAAQKRVEMKLQQKLHKESNLDADNYELRMDKEMEALNLDTDSIRTASVPMSFSAAEKRKFDGTISSVDLEKLQCVTEAQKALVVCGDTNYRLSLPGDTSSNSQKVVNELIKNGRWNDLLQHDQLSREIKLKKIFVGFKEPAIHFAPTFKVKNDCIGNWIITPPSSSSSSSSAPLTNTLKTNANPSKLKRRPVPVSASSDSAPSIESIPYYVPIYDGKRLPAYTDRILYVPRPYFSVIEGTYTSTGNSGSDHLPVASTYEFEAPLTDTNKLHFLRGKFTEAWDAVINKMQFIDMDNKVTIRHSMESLRSDMNWQTHASYVEETVSTDGGNVAFSAVVGETIYVTINIKNIVDESFNLNVKEQTSGGWFGTKISVDCKQVKDYNMTEYPIKNFLPSCKIESHSKGEIILTLTPTNAGLLERVLVTEIPEYSLCPAYRKFIALTIDVKDLFGTSFENISNDQFENIKECFDFVCEESIGGLLARMEDLGSSGDFNLFEWELVREVTLWKFSKDKYKQLNIDGIEAVKRREPEKFNLGSKTVMSFLYIWLKSQSSNFNTDSTRGKVIFSRVIKLVKHLKLDADKGYFWFGWLFDNEYELGDYLERDFDVKVQL